MEQADQELKNLLHYLNLPAALWVPVRIPAHQCRDSDGVCRTYAVFAEPTHEERCAAGDPCAACSQVQPSQHHYSAVIALPQHFGSYGISVFAVRSNVRA